MMPDSMISYKNNGGYKIPLTNSTEDARAVQRAWDFVRITHPHPFLYLLTTSSHPF